MKGDDGLEEEGLRSQEKESVEVGGGLLVLSFEFKFLWDQESLAGE
jgi:hypothetical protein